MDSTQQIWATVLTSAGFCAFLSVVAQGIFKHLNGTVERERIRDTGLKRQRNEAWAMLRDERARADHADERSDVEAYNRRLTEEYASQLRRDCTEHGVSDQELRPWPKLKELPTFKPPQEPK